MTAIVHRRRIRVHRRRAAAPPPVPPRRRGAPGDVGAAGREVRAQRAPELAREHEAQVLLRRRTGALRRAVPLPAARAVDDPHRRVPRARAADRRPERGLPAAGPGRLRALVRPRTSASGPARGVRLRGAGAAPRRRSPAPTSSRAPAATRPPPSSRYARSGAADTPGARWWRSKRGRARAATRRATRATTPSAAARCVPTSRPVIATWRR